MTGIVMFGLMMALMTLGIPIVFAIALAALIGTFAIGPAAPWIAMPLSFFNGMDSFPLMAIPFFILAGELMNSGGISSRLIAFSTALVGHIRGGLGHTTVVANALMSAVSGSALAQIGALGRVLIPAMEKEGYERDFATAITVTASLLGPIIPPSIIMVLYAVSAGASIGGLFLAGIAPGILIAAGMMAVIYFRARKQGYPIAERFSVARVAVTGRDALVALLMPVIILGGIFGGVMTPTESAAVAVLYALIVGFFVFRELTLAKLAQIFLNTGVTTGFIMLIVGAARFFSDLMAREGIPQAIAEGLLGLSDTAAVQLLIINLLLLLVGALMDETAAIIILVPVLLPVITEVGIDPMLFGIVMCVNMTLGMAMPPVGIALFLGADIGKVRLESVVKRMWPLLAVQVAVLFLITYVPAIALFLPRYFGY